MSQESTHQRHVSRVVTAGTQTEGGGFVVRRPFPRQELPNFDPFILLDQMGPVDYGPRQAIGAPDHPHRGFETVTYMLDGRFEHRDSHGNHGVLSPGDVQWMTAGGGVVHSEMPERSFFETGGRMHGVQLWVNLPKKDKMIPPRYQDTPAAKLPVVESDDGLVWTRIVAGRALGTEAVIETRTPILYLHHIIQPGGSVTVDVPEAYRAFVYVLSGNGSVGDAALDSGQLGALSNDGASVTLAVPADATEPMSALLLGGVPLREPVVQFGPFVMNTNEEIHEAIRDYQLGRMGTIAPRTD